MPFCIECTEPFPTQRRELGYNTCRSCGDRQATAEKRRKSRCIAPAYSKGAYQYITSKNMAKDVGRKTS